MDNTPRSFRFVSHASTPTPRRFGEELSKKGRRRKRWSLNRGETLILSEFGGRIFGVKCGQKPSRLVQVVAWINEIQTAESLGDLHTSGSPFLASLILISRCVIQNVGSGLKNIPHGGEDAAQKTKIFPTRHQIAWMISQYVRIGDTDEASLDFNEILEVHTHRTSELTDWSDGA